ncbi:MAG TPA: hypothetical protein VLL48_12750, partial [Longimicrobiales bacterium]|nr:hypothetical protein [Longimicrobiales bacterium]
ILFPAGPFPRRSVSGWVETDPDALRADDRRYFAFRVRPPVRMAGPGVDGPARDESGAFFLEQALTALEGAGRIERVQRTEAGVVLAREGADLEAPGPGTAVVVIPPEDPALLPGLNRGLVRAGIPLELRQVPGAGEAGLRVSGVPVDLADVRVRRAYGMTLGGGSGARTLATLTSGEPWIVSGLATRGNPYLVVASPLDSGSSSLPVSASMMPFLDWILTAWSAREPAGRGLVVGDPVPFAEEATTVAAPDGTLHSVGRSSTAVVSRSAGIYRVLAGDSLLDLVAVNTPLPESRLAPLPSRRLRQLVGPGLVEVERAAAWPRAVFTRRQGPELWRPLLVAAALLLVLESWLAATGHREARKREAPSRGREKRVSA